MSLAEIQSFLPVIVTALSIGFLGSGHCVGMCGGIASALSFAIPNDERGKKTGILLAYNFGRIFSYGILGALAGLLGEQLGLDKYLRILAAALLIAMGLYLADWWRGLVYLEKAGAKLWRFIEPVGKKLLPVKSIPQGFMLGMVWGWLPCGLVYSALAFAVAQSSAVGGALVMLAFGLGTLPAILASGWAAHSLKSFLQKNLVRKIFALLIMAFGVWTLWMPLSHSGHGNMDHSKMNHEQMDHSKMNHKDMDQSKMDPAKDKTQ